MATLLALALVVAACSGSESEGTTVAPTETTMSTDGPIPTSTTTPPAVAAQPAMTMDEALGGTQAVQDFTIYLGIWAETDDGIVSLYEDIVEHAAAAGGSTTELQGGFSYAPTEALDAEVVDADGEPLPSLRPDFGLLDAATEAMEGLAADALAPIEDPNRPGVAGALTPDESVDGRLIVEIVTADYAIARTHVGPGDHTVLNLGFLPGVTADDTIGASYLFGQTLPGEPAVEAGMTPHELFTYRWNQGLVRVLSDADGRLSLGITSTQPTATDASTGTLVAAGPVAIAAPAFSARAVAQEGDAEGEDEEPALVNFVKELVLARVIGETIATAEEAFWENLQVSVFEGQSNRDFFYGPDTDSGLMTIIDTSNARVVYVTRETATKMWTEQYDCPDFTLECMLHPDEILATSDLSRVIRGYALDRALRHCSAAAEELNRRNGAASSPDEVVADNDVAEGAGDSSDATTGAGESNDDEDEEDTTSDGGDDDDTDGPPPVSCPPPPGGIPKLPTGSIYGDVHVATIDGNDYSHQTPGEFLAFDNGVATIQIRTELFTDAGLVTVATAVAARVGDHTVSLHQGGETWVDGEQVEIPRGTSLALGGGELLRWELGWVLLWPDGTTAKVRLSTTQLLLVTPPTGPAHGLLGNADGDPANDLVTRDGEQLAADADKREWERFYDTYIDSWRVTADESLFHYSDGETWAAFEWDGPPTQRTSVELLPADVAADAEAICRAAGLTRDQVLDACILDVGLTGVRGFAYDAYVVQASTPDPEDRPPTVVAGGGNGDTVLTIGDVSLTFGPEPPTQDPDAPAPSWQCQADDGSFFADGSSWETTAGYELRVEYLESAASNTGEERFSVIVRRTSTDYAWVLTYAEHFVDAVDEVLLDGGTLTAAGELYVNDPPTLGLAPFSALPDGSTLTPFKLTASCDQ